MSELLVQQPHYQRAYPYWPLWGRWVLANAAGELVGLGGSLLAVVALAAVMDTETVMGALVMAGAMILFGTFLEGVVVGLAQWWVLRGPFPSIPRRTWLLATAAGAFIAWSLGMIPSTVISLLTAGSEAAGPPPEMSNAVTYMLAAGMGFVLGPVLAVPQWLALRRYVAHAGWWVPANALAWALGMVLVFVGAGSVPPGGITTSVIALLIVTLAAAGATVGAVHGLALLWFVQKNEK